MVLIIAMTHFWKGERIIIESLLAFSKGDMRMSQRWVIPPLKNTTVLAGRRRTGVAWQQCCYRFHSPQRADNCRPYASHKSGTENALYMYVLVEEEERSLLHFAWHSFLSQRAMMHNIEHNRILYIKTHKERTRRKKTLIRLKPYVLSRPLSSGFSEHRSSSIFSII